MIKEIEGSLFKLKIVRDRGRDIAISKIKGMVKNDAAISDRVDRMLDHVFIPLVNLDPYGVIQKLEHFVDMQEFLFKDEVKLMVPEADETEVNNLSNMLEAALILNQIYKIVRHYYLMGKKSSSFYIILQLQMILPQIMKESQAFANALTSFMEGHPIGDGIGALIVAKMMKGKEKREIAKNIVLSKVQFEDRTAYILKAKGPGGNVGKPGEAVKQIIEEKKSKISRIIVIDAALKLEGEKIGSVTEGIGVAIGGPGVDKFKVEEIATKYKIPINAILVKQGVRDAISTMRKEISDSAEEVINRVRRIINETTKAGDTVIIAGIGNTIGIAQ
jgi:hypothetical protein